MLISGLSSTKTYLEKRVTDNGGVEYFDIYIRIALSTTQSLNLKQEFNFSYIIKTKDYYYIAEFNFRKPTYILFL